MSGATAYHGGQAAEDQVAARYIRLGAELRARRWRGRGGEIDLIFATTAGLVFVEVKRAASHVMAAQRLGPRQIARLQAAAGEYLAAAPGGQDSDMRFDVALVDGAGRIEIVENALWL
ncbi:MAG: YraN family protein [Defluviimonas sp.]|uniref:YraN family protein n=1 Tax=Albidovulum sp. TaxID=1872424 RepID=UPI001E0CFF0D|nr:YraN family protein [Paracoccaceae bacterium]MCC0065292.1 YraN family protein [Defluviimonas sp.]